MKKIFLNPIMNYKEEDQGIYLNKEINKRLHSAI